MCGPSPLSNHQRKSVISFVICNLSNFLCSGQFDDDHDVDVDKDDDAVFRSFWSTRRATSDDDTGDRSFARSIVKKKIIFRTKNKAEKNTKKKTDKRTERKEAKKQYIVGYKAKYDDAEEEKRWWWTWWWRWCHGGDKDERSLCSKSGVPHLIFSFIHHRRRFRRRCALNLDDKW